jgi:riboflavin kinase/FMN adenylyltransferase
MTLSQLIASDRGYLIVCGTVVHGDHRGRTLGVPTANVDLEGHQITDGVWAGWFQRPDGTVHATAVSVGVRATFYGRRGVRLLEAHLIDFDGDLYGEFVRVSLDLRIRGQRKFSSLEALIEQMNADINAARDWSESAAASRQLAFFAFM